MRERKREYGASCVRRGGGDPGRKRTSGVVFPSRRHTSRRDETSRPRSGEKECVTPVCVTTVGAQTNDDDDNGDDTSRFFCYIKTFRCYILPPWDTVITPGRHKRSRTRAGNSVSTYANLRNLVCCVFWCYSSASSAAPPAPLPPPPLLLPCPSSPRATLARTLAHIKSCFFPPARHIACHI